MSDQFAGLRHCSVQFVINHKGVVKFDLSCLIYLVLRFREPSIDRVLIIAASRLKPSEKFEFIRWQDKNHEGVRHRLAHLTCALDVDVQNDEFTSHQGRLYGPSGSTVSMPAKDLGPLQKFTPLPHSLEFGT